MERWHGIPLFPGYSVSDLGRVRNDETGRFMVCRLNQAGIPYVGLTRDRRQFKRSLAVLVAEAFLADHNKNKFNTPIHLDGDPTNNTIDNILLRPRWFAHRYTNQFKVPRRGMNHPIEDIATREQFKNSWEAATKYGLLDREILFAILNRGYVFPTFQEFRVV